MMTYLNFMASQMSTRLRHEFVLLSYPVLCYESCGRHQLAMGFHILISLKKESKTYVLLNVYYVQSKR